MSRILKAFLENESALKRFLRRLAPRGHDVEDFAQETFLKAFAAEAKQDIEQPRAFLFLVARNLARDERRKKSRAVTDSMEEFADPDVLGSISVQASEDQLEARQLLGLLVQAAATLSPQCKEVFMMQRVYGFSHKEIANRLKIATSTVEKHVAAGLLKCSKFMLRHGYEVERGRLRLKKEPIQKPTSRKANQTQG